MTVPAGPWWRLGQDGEPTGPFSDSEMREALRTGRLHAVDPIWSPDVKDWQAFDVLFPRDDGRDPKAPLILLLCAGFGFTITAATVVALIVGRDVYEEAAPTSLHALRGIWLGLVVAMAATTFVLAWLARRCAALLRGCLRARRGLYAASSSAAVLGSMLTLLQWLATSEVPDDIVRNAHRRYSIRLAHAPDRLVVEGSIGRGFATSLQLALDRLPDPIRIEINSPGGLLAEAMKATRVIETRAGSTVIARSECNSACIHILMAGEHRLAERDMRLGFHAASTLGAAADRSSLFGFNLAVAIVDYYEGGFLERRGVPPDILAEMDRIGSDQVHNVEAQTLLKRGVLTGLVDPLPIEERRGAIHLFMKAN